MSLIGDILMGADEGVWKALADPTRRRILETLSDEAVTTGDIVVRFQPVLVRTAVMKHLDVLESAGLIRVERIGRQRWNHLQPKLLERAAGWLDKRIQTHQRNLKSLKNLVESKSTTAKMKPKT